MPRRRATSGLVACLAGSLLWVVPAAVSAQAGSTELRCERCHGSLELLQGQTGHSARAHEVLIPLEAFEASVHADFACADCHEGFEAYPHESAGQQTLLCQSCHDEPSAAVTESVHHARGATSTCTVCHGAHDVAPIAALSTSPGEQRMNETCLGCHAQAQAWSNSAHADLACFDCHGAHEVQSAQRARSSAESVQVCGGCHAEPWDAWAPDVHGSVFTAGRSPAEGAPTPPTCVQCHGGHDILPAHDSYFHHDMVNRCSVCHPDAARTAHDAYHIKATTLGSEITASCADCHGAHGIYPGADPRSRVSAEQRLSTCRRCHPEARPSFAQYQPHPDPRDRDKNPYVFYSFWFMNLMLVGVLGVFLLHTLTWWIRILIDRRRGTAHGGGR